MTSRNYFDKMNSILGSVVPLAMFEIENGFIMNWPKPTYIRALEQPSRQVEREDDSERRNQQQPGCHWYHQH